MRIALLAGLLISALLATPGAAAHTGTVRDAAGAAVANASVEILSAGGTLLHVLRTDTEGRFHWEESRRGFFQVRVMGDGFALSEIVVSLQKENEQVAVTLQPQSVYTRITVSATRGGAEEAISSPHVAIVKDRADIMKRPGPTIGNVLEQEPGVLVQQSTSGQVSPFLRGLTGYQVLNLVDGIRFNNSTFRSGPNQYLAFVEPIQAQRVEALLGPTRRAVWQRLAGRHHQRDDAAAALLLRWPPRGARTATSCWRAHRPTCPASATRVSPWPATRSSGWSALPAPQHNDLRAGGGYDSRNVFHRFFGMSLDDVRDLVGSRQQDSGFRQYGRRDQTGLSASSRSARLTLNYQRGVQDRSAATRTCWAGWAGCNRTSIRKCSNWFYGRYEKLRLGLLDSLTGTSRSTARRTAAPGRTCSTPTRSRATSNRVDACGYSGQATTHWTQPAARFIRRRHLRRTGQLPSATCVTRRRGRVTRPRPLYPDRSRYQNLGVFGQTQLRHLTSACAPAAGFGSPVSGSPRAKTEAFGIPDRPSGSATSPFNRQPALAGRERFGIHGVVSRGFRAPNLNDLGALGPQRPRLRDPGVRRDPRGSAAEHGCGRKRRCPKERALSAPGRRIADELRVRRAAHIRPRCTRARSSSMPSFPTRSFAARCCSRRPAVPTQLAGLPVTPLTPTAGQQAAGRR